ncbi:hypothetical protein PLEOSDRAFT_1111124 [Pleurotus ostreatus PC15]|uniref:HCP-like protein n=1 Tax=Pleurotus ostreatus (strain PC15) TaxID=1137138 RepID=A0A067NYX5_PLEO1|nr:hypothetical protein PLEOSDRAFT_1111124 [Pleurotus ostreatus PC15]
MSAPSLPPVPPRPYDSNQRQNSLPPPVPPLPPDYRGNYSSPPHFDNPLAAPRPYRADPSIPANMAQSLEASSVNYSPGFVVPNRGPSPLPPQGGYPQRGASPLPPPQGTNWQPWNAYSSPPPPQAPYAPQQAPYPPQQAPYPPQQAPYPPQPYAAPPPPQQPPHYAQSPPIPHSSSIEHGMANLSFSPQQPQQSNFHRTPSIMSTYGPPPKAPSPPRSTAAAPSLTATLPTIATLLQALPTVQSPSHDPTLRLAWARDVIFLVNRSQNSQSNDIPVGPATISDPQLARLVQTAVPLVVELASPRSPQTPVPAYVAEAIYWRATFEASGAFPDHVRHDPRSAFRDFESAARSGYHAAWFRLGRDYENFNDVSHAKDCFERGVKYGVESCLYRLGMAHLMGQLGLPANVDLAIPLLHRAATLASLDVPQPAYVYALLLLGEFSHITVPASAFASVIPQSSSPALDARKHLERAAYLHFPPAQYKLGHAYEFAQPPFPFDALLSVQYYSLASQQGEVEADMALSKWFLCGAEGAFEKDEALAWTFADKAARKGLPSAMFAMGYYAEVGVGGPKDIETATKWYRKAADQGNDDAKERLNALTGPTAQPLSRQEHDSITEVKLVRKRTQAKQRSEARPTSNDSFLDSYSRPSGDYGNGQSVIENIRKNSLSMPEGYHPPSLSQPQHGRMPSVPENNTYGLQHSPPPMQSPLPGGGPGQRPPPAAGPGVGLRPQPAGGRQYPAAQRYTLTDPGAASGSPPPGQRPTSSGGRAPSHSPRPSPARIPSGGGYGEDAGGMGGGPGFGGGGTSQASTRPNKQTGASTFAEMGFQGAKVEDKECVIM